MFNYYRGIGGVSSETESLLLFRMTSVSFKQYWSVVEWKRLQVTVCPKRLDFTAVRGPICRCERLWFRDHICISHVKTKFKLPTWDVPQPSRRNSIGCWYPVYLISACLPQKDTLMSRLQFPAGPFSAADIQRNTMLLFAFGISHSICKPKSYFIQIECWKCWNSHGTTTKMWGTSGSHSCNYSTLRMEDANVYGVWGIYG